MCLTGFKQFELGSCEVVERPSLLIVVIAFLSAQAIFAQAPFNATVPGVIMTHFRNQRITWTTNAWVYANALFGIAVIEFSWSAAVTR